MPVASSDVSYCQTASRGRLLGVSVCTAGLSLDKWTATARGYWLQSSDASISQQKRFWNLT